IYIVGCFISSVLAVICFYLFRFGILDPWSHLLFIPLRTIHSTFADDVILFQDYISAFFKHRAAVGANLVMAIACLIYLVKGAQGVKRWRLGAVCFVGIFFVCVIYASGSRSGLISLFSVLAISVIYLFISNRKRLVVAFLLIFVLFSAFLSLKTTRSLLTSEISTLNYSKLRTADPRFRIWESTVDIIKENLIVGVGYSEVYPRLFEKYNRMGLVKFTKERFNSHNQFLQFSLESGVWAGVLYAVFLLPIYFGKENRYLSFSFSATFFFYSMFEDSLILINGVSLLVFFIAILYLSDKKRKELSE
ncbi:MAG TPA: O-antigen ligase family protein, partial [Paludibacter sp.]|nr:O-antigen ligase family protein [Paludibacter sp.]